MCYAGDTASLSGEFVCPVTCVSYTFLIFVLFVDRNNYNTCVCGVFVHVITLLYMYMDYKSEITTGC